MRLDKWYLDAVFPDRSVWFGYRAQLVLGRCPSIPWTFACEVFPDGRERTASRWKSLAEPRLKNGQWLWHGPDGFGACWEPLSPGAESVLASDAQLRVRWHCLTPRAKVTRICRNGVTSDEGQNAAFQGIGYIEHLQIETSSPRLPFRELHWGRACAGESSLVWIRWGRGRELTLLLEDGVRVDGRLEPLGEGGVRIETAQGQWETGSGRPLCDRNVRRSFPRWLVWLTREIAPVRELKMSGPVRFRASSGDLIGSGIWEEVRWL
jgi:hypothetical protein